MEFALDVADATVWEWDFRTDSVTTHPETHTILGADVTTGESFLDGIYPEDRPRVQTALETAIETGSPYNVEYRVRDGDTVHWVEDYGKVRREGPRPGPGTDSETGTETETDTATRMVGVARDITARKQREQALQERVKELTAIHSATRVFETTDGPLDVVLSEFVRTLPRSFQHPDCTAARLSCGEFEVSTDSFETRDRMLSARTEIAGGPELRLDVVYLDRSTDADPFLAEERDLLDTLVFLVKAYIERRGDLPE
jgi:hypothetical protein